MNAVIIPYSQAQIKEKLIQFIETKGIVDKAIIKELYTKFIKDCNDNSVIKSHGHGFMKNLITGESYRD